jgi:hypothetical protein
VGADPIFFCALLCPACFPHRPGRARLQRAGAEDRLHSSTDFPKIDTEASQRDLVFLAKGLILLDVSKIFDEPLLERRDRLR